MMNLDISTITYNRRRNVYVIMGTAFLLSIIITAATYVFVYQFRNVPLLFAAVAAQYLLVSINFYGIVIYLIYSVRCRYAFLNDSLW